MSRRERRLLGTSVGEESLWRVVMGSSKETKAKSREGIARGLQGQESVGLDQLRLKAGNLQHKESSQP